MTKSDQIIEFIKASPTGRRFGEIQRFIVELNGHNYDEMEPRKDWMTGKITQVRRWRGYWCTRLIGGVHYGRGLLHSSGCAKVGGRWVFQGA